jgi:hypothetical protein
MKYLKILGLAVALTALQALVGMGTASASVLCKTNLETCPSAWDYGSGTTLNFGLKASTSIILETSNHLTVWDKCSGSTIKGSTSNTGGAGENVLVPISTANLTWSGCSATTKTLAGGELELHWLPLSTNATVATTGFKWTVNGAGGDCVFTFENALEQIGTLKEGKPAEIEVSARVSSASGGLCPTKTILTATYVASEPAGTLAVSSE